MYELTIAVSGLNAVDNPGPGIPVIRSLKSSQYKNARIIGLCYGTLEPGAYLRECVDKVYLMPYPSEGEEALLNRLSYIQQTEHIDVIVPNLDAEMLPYIRLEKRLQSLWNIRMVLPSEVQFSCRQKESLGGLCDGLPLEAPHFAACGSLEDYYIRESEFHYPVVVKGCLYEAYVAYNRSQVEDFFSRVSCKWGLPVIVQQFVAGTELNVVGNADGEGNLLSDVAMRKMFITDKGKAWSGITIEDADLRRLAEAFVRKTLWRGPFELELLKDAAGEVFLLEVNPRMPAWVYLATAVGQNIPEQVVSMALGECVSPNTHYEAGKLFVRYSWDMVVDYEEYGRFSVRGEL